MHGAATSTAKGLRLREDDLPPVLLFIALGAFALLTPAHNDTWWLLRSGQEMWQTGAFLTSERFSHTAFGEPLHNHWWLTQLTFFAMYQAGGSVLLTLFAGLCAWAAVFGSWRLLRGSLEVRIVLLVFLALATAPEWAVRPQVVSLALLVLCGHLIARERTLWLPLVCLVWANAHAMVIFGVLMAGACALEALLWRRDRLVHDGAIALGCALAPMLSPLGWEYWPRVLTTVSMSRALELHEYRPPLEAADLPFWIGVAALMVFAWRERRSLGDRPRAVRILLISAALLAVAAATATRNVAFFAVIAAPVLSWLWPAAARSPRHVPAGRPAYALIAIAVLAAGTAVLFKWSGGGIDLGWRPLAPATVEAVRQCPDPLFNTLEDGGYLMWSLPDRKVFVDSRMEAYSLELLEQSRRADLFGEYRRVFDDYGIKCALVVTGSRMGERLAADPLMTATYVDASRTVFVHRSVFESATRGDGSVSAVGRRQTRR